MARGQIKVADVKDFLSETTEILEIDKGSMRMKLATRSGDDGSISHDDLYAIDSRLAYLFHGQ